MGGTAINLRLAEVTVAMHRALVVQDGDAIEGVLPIFLAQRGFRVVLANSYARGQLDTRSYRPDVVIVDLQLTDLCGINFIRALRVWSAIPVVALSARSSEAQRLEAFEAGVDDYVERPFSPLELVARLHALLRRYSRADFPQSLLKLGSVCVDLERRLARHGDGRKLHLTPLEHRMLETFVRSADRLITHKQLMREVWGPYKSDVCAVRVCIASLRRKLEHDPSFPMHIVTEIGTGYRLVVGTAPVAAPA